MPGSEEVVIKTQEKDLEAEIRNKLTWPFTVLNSFMAGKDKIFILLRN